MFRFQAPELKAPLKEAGQTLGFSTSTPIEAGEIQTWENQALSEKRFK